MRVCYSKLFLYSLSFFHFRCHKLLVIFFCSTICIFTVECRVRDWHVSTWWRIHTSDISQHMPSIHVEFCVIIQLYNLISLWINLHQLYFTFNRWRPNCVCITVVGCVTLFLLTLYGIRCNYETILFRFFLICNQDTITLLYLVRLCDIW